MRLVIAAFALMFASTFAYADSGLDTKAVSDESAKAVAKPNKRSCRKVKVTGSNIKQRVCMTNSSWRKLEEQQEEERRKARALSSDPGNAIN